MHWRQGRDLPPVIGLEEYVLQVADETHDDSRPRPDWRLIDALPVAAVVCDGQGRIEHWAPQASRLFGTTPAVGDPFVTAAPLFDVNGAAVAAHLNPITRALIAGHPVDDDVWIAGPDGSRVAVQLVATPLRDDAGEVDGVLATIQDAGVSSRFDTHQATLAAIVSSSDDAIVSKTLDGVITSWNSGAERIFGYTAQEAVGRHISLIIPSDRLDEETEVLAKIRRGEKIDHFETVRQTRDGRLIDISLTVSPVRNTDGVVVGASKVARDITDRNAANRALGFTQRRYRRLFDAAGVSLWEEDFSAVKAAIDEVMGTGVTDFPGYLREHPEFVDRCLELLRVADVNRATLQMFGARDKRELMSNISRVFGDSTKGVFAGELVAIAERRTQFEAETDLRTLSGDRIDVLLAIRFPDDRDPRESDVSFDSVLVSLTDITERRLAEEALRAESQVRQTLANVGASFAAELDQDKLVQAVTDAATHVTEAEFGAFVYRASGEAGESYRLHAVAGLAAAKDQISSDDRVAQLFAQTLHLDAIVRSDDLPEDPRPAVRIIPDMLERTRLRSYLAVPVFSRSRELLGGLVFGHSAPAMFTARHEQLAAGIASWAALSLDNARLYKAAQDANTTKDEFLATLSHELRTPLNAMLGWTHLLRSGSLAADMRLRALDALERNGRAQAQLVDDLLDVSRIVSGRMQLKLENIDLGGVISSAIETLRPAAAAKQLTVRMRMPDKAVVVHGDADRLRQILWNLLSNAVKFTQARGRIDIDLHADDAGAEIRVHDNGLGIRRDFLPLVFDRFRQADSSHARKFGGLGLGLAIVRHLVEAHGGTVAVDSAGEHQGSTFTVRFPVASVTRLIRQERAAVGGSAQSLKGIRVLVVDDEKDAREFMAALLSLHGADVSVAASAGEALRLISKQPMDVLLADLGLPDRDGYSLIEAIRSLGADAGGSVPAVAVTAYAGLRERSRAFEAGYGWHVAKPVDPDQLLSVVHAAIAPRDDTTA